MHALFVDNLTVIDFAYFHPQRGIVGESLILDVTLYGDLNEEGMLFDFSHVKKKIKSCVDSLVDHKFLVPSQSSFVEVLAHESQLKLALTIESGEKISHSSPHQAVFFIDDNQVTPDSISQSIQKTIKNILPENVNKLEIGLRPEVIEGPFYHYSHGLKKHDGDCQRIAHGHRSKIEVWQDGKIANDWSLHIAKIWKDIYLATKEDIIDEYRDKGVDYYTFQYRANQGEFTLSMPKARCFIIETDTTVELIADFLAKLLKQEKQDSNFVVKAYEGVDKGAIASR